MKINGREVFLTQVTSSAPLRLTVRDEDCLGRPMCRMWINGWQLTSFVSSEVRDGNVEEHPDWMDAQKGWS